MSEQTPSQAEGERDDATDTYDPPRTTPSQAEGEREDDVEDVPETDYARALDEEEPGSHSGLESQPREPEPPGTATGDPLTGVEGTADDERSR
ncbi:hypothetical protein RKD49_001049 [Streptomyces glaucescens]|jgi:hypothetical protein